MKMGGGGAGVDNESITEAISGGAPEARKMIESFGGKVIGNYLTMGRYDFVLLVDLPDAESAARVSMKLHEFGGSIETLRAFPESEWPAIARGM